MLIHLNLKLGGKSSFHVFSIILILSLEFLSMFVTNVVLKERMGSLPFHEYALELLFKAPTLPQNAKKHTFMGPLMISTTSICAPTHSIQCKFPLLLAFTFPRSVCILEYNPIKYNFTSIGMFKHGATIVHLGLKMGLVWNSREIIISFILPINPYPFPYHVVLCP